jgi:hypothetical protein
MSSYSNPAAVGDPKATGAYAVAIAAQAGGVNNDGHATDSAGNVVIDRVWGNFPLQPNDERRASVSQTGGSTGDTGWSQTTYVASSNLTYPNVSVSLNNGITQSVPSDNHVVAESGYAGYPAYTSAHQAVYIITQASGDGTTQTYTAPNNLLKAGDTVNITGTGLDGNSLTVASANRYTFTVSGSGTGSYINISGKVRYTDELTANDGAYVSGTDYVLVPNVLGFTTALAVDAMTDAELVQTTASAATNTPISITAAARTASSSTATVTATGAGAAFPVGTKITIAGLADATTTELNGTWTVTANATNTVSFVSNNTTAISVASPTGTPTVKGTTGTIKTQSVAAGAASISAGAAVTLTPWA